MIFRSGLRASLCRGALCHTREMTAPLVPCEACARHLRADEARCPFCGAAHAPQDLAYAPIPRMSRAALAALGAMLTVVPVAALVGMEEADAQSHTPSIRPLYGVPPRPLPVRPPTRDAGAPPDASAPTDAGAHHDASAPTDAGARRDAGAHRAPRPPRRLYPPETMPVPLYGISPDKE